MSNLVVKIWGIQSKIQLFLGIFEIQQNILARTIAFDNEPTISKTLLSVNEDLSIIGIVKKNPSDNATIFIKHGYHQQQMAQLMEYQLQMEFINNMH